MISVEIGSLLELDTEAAVRAVSGELEPVTPLSRDLGGLAGMDVLERLVAQGSFPVGGAVITPGGKSPARFLIHVVVLSAEEPITMSGVAKALVNGLRRATHFGIQEFATPALGVGAGNLEVEESAIAMADALIQHRDAEGLPERVRVVVSSEYERTAFEGALRRSGLMEEGSE